MGTSAIYLFVFAFSKMFLDVSTSFTSGDLVPYCDFLLASPAIFSYCLRFLISSFLLKLLKESLIKSSVTIPLFAFALLSISFRIAASMTLLCFP